MVFFALVHVSSLLTHSWYAFFPSLTPLCLLPFFPSVEQTQGWNTVGDAGGVPVWAADTLGFRGTGNKMKVTDTPIRTDSPRRRRPLSVGSIRPNALGRVLQHVCRHGDLLHRGASDAGSMLSDFAERWTGDSRCRSRKAERRHLHMTISDLWFVATGILCRFFCFLLQMPLFTNVDDLMTSWERLKTEAGSETKAPTIQVLEYQYDNRSPHSEAWVPWQSDVFLWR